MQRSRTLSEVARSVAISPRASAQERSRRSRLRREGQRWTRWLHVYSSMIALVVVLFFSVTGLTLNHPSWTFGFDPVTETFTGRIPDDSLAEDGTVEFLLISNYLRQTYDVDGDVSDYGTTGDEGYIIYRGPGYSADVFFEIDSGTFELDIEQQGLIAVLNDLHRGRDTTGSWNWLIDFSAVFLIVIALTGLGLQLFLSKRRRLALIVAVTGGLITMMLTLVAVS